MSEEHAIQSGAVRQLTKLVEESTPSDRRKRQVFHRAYSRCLGQGKNKRHHVIFGRRGSGKSSYFIKLRRSNDQQNAHRVRGFRAVQGSQYPDVLISVLISTLTEFKKWLDTAATNPASKTSFWKKLFGTIPTKAAFSKKETTNLSGQFETMIAELTSLLFQADKQKNKDSKIADDSTEAKLGSKIESSGLPAKASVEGSLSAKSGRLWSIKANIPRIRLRPYREIYCVTNSCSSVYRHSLMAPHFF